MSKHRHIRKPRFRQIPRLPTPYMEESVDKPLSEILTHIQWAIMENETYMGIPTFKNPVDAWIYQEIIYETQPDVIIELGNHCGGSTLYLAHLCDNIGYGRVIGVDIDQSKISAKVRQHPRIILLQGDACALLRDVISLIGPQEHVLVIEDTSHTFQNTLNILLQYSRLLQVGDYFIVEDGIVGHGLPQTTLSGNPYDAVEYFIRQNDNFQIDRSRERYVITHNPKGFLKKVK